MPENPLPNTTPSESRAAAAAARNSAQPKSGSPAAKRAEGGGRRRRKKRGGGAGRDELDARQLAREYGFAYTFFKSDPELWDLLQKAVDKTWSAQRFSEELKTTKWYRKHSDKWRQATALKHTDPATYRERLGDMRTQIKDLASQWGAQLTKVELDRLSERAFLLGWSPDQILDHIAKDVKPVDGVYGGELAGIQQRLKETAYRNGVKIPPDQMKKWMRMIVRGDAEPTQFESYIRKVASQTFGAYSNDIKGGMDAIEVAAPYMQSMAEILELNPASIDMYDKTIRRALSYKNDKGEAQPMSITDFEDALRADKRWQYTQNAKEQLMGYALELGKMWGVLG